MPSASKFKHHRDGFSSPPLPSVYAGRLLDDDVEYPELSDNVAVARFLCDLALEDLGGRPITGPSEAGDEIIAEMMARETVLALTRTDVPTSADWYTSAIRRMTAVLSMMHPEISSDEAAAAHPSGLFRDSSEARTVLFAAMAITSQNVPVFDNMRYALEQYCAFCETGAFQPRTYGTAGLSVSNNLRRFNLLVEAADGDLTSVARLLSMKMKMSEFKVAARRFGINVPGRELAGETVYGSMIFGPKVGNGFYQNLIGNHEPVTIDLWFCRLWGRYTGTLVGDGVPEEIRTRLSKGLRSSLKSVRMRAMMEAEGVAYDPKSVMHMDAKELLDASRRLCLFWERLRRRVVAGTLSPNLVERRRPGPGMDNAQASEFKSKLMWPGAAEAAMKAAGRPVDSPRNAAMRKWMRDVCGKALDKLRGYGYDLNAADMQAILWFPEKEIYGKLTGRPMDRYIVSYDDAAIQTAKQKGFSDERIQSVLRAAGADGSRGPAVPAGDGFGHSGADDGLPEGTPVDVGEEADRDLEEVTFASPGM